MIFCGRDWLRAKFLFAAWFKIWISNLSIEIKKSKPSGGVMGGKLISDCKMRLCNVVSEALGVPTKALAVKMTSSGGKLISGVWKKKPNP